MVNFNKIIASRTTKRDTTTFTRPSGAGNFDNMDDKNIVDQINIKRGTVDLTPTDPKDIVNKAYVDAGGGGGSGNVTAAANIGDNLLIRGDGAVKGIQNSGITISDTDQITGILDLTLTGDLTIPDEGLKDATNTSASFFVNNGTNYVPVVMSGEATMAADGSVTLLGGDAASVIQIAKVNEGGGISKGQIVYISGATGGFPQVSLASNDDYAKSEVLAIANETKSDTQTIIVTLLGEFTGLNTSTFTEGQILYLGTSGNITNTHPTGLNAVVRIGKAIKINISTGTLIFNPDPLIAIASVDGFVRTQIVNTNTGTSAIVNTTYVNDAGHYLSINMQGSNNTFGSSEASMYNLGYGNTKYIVDGNKDHVFYTDVSDAHDGSSFTEKMRLSAAGNLTLTGTVDGIDIATDVAANTSASHNQNTDTALGSGAEAADHGTAATDQIVNIAYGTGSPPTANTTTIGSLFVKYTA